MCFRLGPIHCSLLLSKAVILVKLCCIMRKPVYRVSDQAVQPEKITSGLGSRGIVPCSKSKGADQLRCCGTAVVSSTK